MGLFDVHRLNAAGLDKARKVRDVFYDAMLQLELICGTDGRDMAIVRTKLQEGCFFAKRAMAVLPENQEAE